MKSIPSKDLLTFFKTQAKIRISELYVAKRYPEEKMKCPMHMCVGQESIAAALGLYARAEDLFMGNYRSHGHYIAKGGDLKKLFAEILGRTDGCSGGYGGSMHIIDQSCGFYGASAIVAGTVPISMGLGLSVKYKKEDRIVIGIFGDGAVEEGVVYETLSFAKLLKLPVLFVCENNKLAVETPIDIRTPTFNISERFASFGVKSDVIETLDVEAMLNKTSEVLAHVRTHREPLFLEYRVNRFANHVGPVCKGPVDAWWQDPQSKEAASCSLAQTVRLLVEKKVLTMNDVKSFHEKTSSEVARIFNDVDKNSKVPDLEEPKTLVYASGLLSTLPKNKKSIQKIGRRAPIGESSKMVNPF